MKILRFENAKKRAAFGKYEDGSVFEISGDVFGKHSVTGERYDYGEIKPLAPCLPTKIIAVGLNYRAHAREMKKELPREPMLFMKPSTAVIAQKHQRSVCASASKVAGASLPCFLAR